MGFGSLLRKGIEIVDTLTGGADGFQDTVTMHPWTGSDDFGGPTFGTPVAILAIIEMKTQQRQLTSGDVVTQHASFLIPRPVAANGATGRFEPIDPRDKFVLPNGYTGPVLSVDGPEDPTTDAPFVTTVVLG